MRKRKDTEWYDGKIRSIKKRKRKLTKSIKAGLYGSDSISKNNNEIKAEKEDLKREKRAAKRAEKQNLKKDIDDAIDGME